jgi:hypothetical protein
MLVPAHPVTSRIMRVCVDVRKAGARAKTDNDRMSLAAHWHTAKTLILYGYAAAMNPLL